MPTSPLQNNRHRHLSADRLPTAELPVEDVRRARACQTFRSSELRSEWVDARLPKLKQEEEAKYKDEPSHEQREHLMSLSEHINRRNESLRFELLEKKSGIDNSAKLLPRDLAREYSRLGRPALSRFTSVDTATDKLEKSKSPLPAHPLTLAYRTDLLLGSIFHRFARRQEDKALDKQDIRDDLAAHSHDIYRIYDALEQDSWDLQNLVFSAIEKDIESSLMALYCVREKVTCKESAKLNES
ncbi:hypothetical protein [Martelella sp. HB161492]|uniref:hypothetical protein n=1 Tax=Martelella sp. HB161492 TaxID=2720726 RepID=UPI00158FE2C9|nr:hypothetical protein [Martelella sp. HB161492]